MVRPRVLAASFVVTVVAGCGGAAPPADGVDAARPPGDAGVTTDPPDAPGASDAAPPRGGTITRRPDGTCWEHAQVKCPPAPATCNPPPPLQVECPPAR